MNNVMIDIETLGTAANSVILSIGAVSFDDEGLLADEFYSNINIDSCLDKGLVVEGRTVVWWMGQSDEARATLGTNELSLPVALQQLTNAFDWRDTLVWCNGLSFDLPILDSAYRACGMQAPWQYYNGRDYRTIKGELPKEIFRALEVKPTIGHNALADAKAQAETLIAIRSLPRGIALAA
jgi:DNA polymerase III epsilon subunit-like protein